MVILSVPFMSFSLIVRSMGFVLRTGSSCVCSHDVVIIIGKIYHAKPRHICMCMFLRVLTS